MSLLKRYAMLAAVSNHNQHQHNNNSNNNTQVTTIMAETETTTAAAITISTTAVSLPRTTKLINSNKSTLIQLKQQQQQQTQQQDIFYTTTSQPTPQPFNSNTNTTTNTTTTTRKYSLNNDNPTLFSDHQSFGSSVGGVDVDSSVSVSSESSESTGLNDNIRSTSKTDDSGQRQQPQNTYTSTTYYGSGFGVFHQQNIRSNGGGIALITGSSGGNGQHLGNSSYSNGINNNVNLLLGGAMLTLITTILCVVCYCCHRNIKKRTEAAYRQQHQWLENDPNMEIYSVEQCYETSGLFVGDSMDGLATIPALHHEPPPSYDAVVAMQEQQQQHLMMQQQQQLMQLLPNNSPPPGYRSSLDVSCMMQQVRAGHGILALGAGGLTGMETNSMASSTSSIRAATSCSPSNDPLGNFSDLNANMAVAATAALATNSNQLSQTNYLRNKQQRNVNATNLTQLNMKKVLQAQSCCSLQRAEVENMWNAAAAALAARSAHHPSESRTVAATSSPTLAVNARKLSQGPTTSRTNMPETFGSRYLKQNYYRSGCPLCGKFRYDNDSPLSISMESNLDAAVTAGAQNDGEERHSNNNREGEDEISQRNINNNLTCNMDENDNDDDNNNNNDNDDEEEGEVEGECSCANRHRKKSQKAENSKYVQQQQQQQSYHQLKLQPNTDEVATSNNIATTAERREELQPAVNTTDNNANMSTTEERHNDIPIPTATTLPSNNNNNSNNNNHTNDTLTEVLNPIPTSAAGPSSSPPASTPALTIVSASSSSPGSVTIDLDCINENGIISLDMSKIIDKTGLPTYDAALKLESSGYV